ncbi:NAD-glutamate dehydrogenase [Pseudomonas aeruginosa]|nr:NAD-glutamate dehydrogenase [Pseudomonas aeruginosa]
MAPPATTTRAWGLPPRAPGQRAAAFPRARHRRAEGQHQRHRHRRHGRRRVRQRPADVGQVATGGRLQPHAYLHRPEPDAASSFVERQRLFNLPRSSWADYDVRQADFRRRRDLPAQRQEHRHHPGNAGALRHPG